MDDIFRSRGIAENFYDIGMDFDRMFLLSADSQWLSSYLLGKFINYFKSRGLQASTFDSGNVPDNDDWICCSVGDRFGKGFNWGCGVIAIKYIKSKRGEKVSWKDFKNFVNSKGGFLSRGIKKEVWMLWNGEGNAAWPIFWAKGITAVGQDEWGIVWKYDDEYDFREKLLEGIL